MRWHPADRPGREEPTARAVRDRTALVFGGDPADAAGVVIAMREAGARVRLAAPAPEPESFLVEGNAPDIVVDLTLPPPFEPDRSGWREPLLRTFAVLRACAPAWSEETTADRLCYLAVTYLGGAMGYTGMDEPAQPLGGLWAGLAKTLHHEIPNCTARVLDVALAERDRLGALVVSEAGLRGSIEVGWRNGRRRTLRARTAHPHGRTRQRRDGVVLISGGARGIGFLIAEHLARGGQPVVVTGRVPAAELAEWQHRDPEDLWDQRFAGRPISEVRGAVARARDLVEASSNLARARAEGLSIEYRKCDVTDRDDVAALLDSLADVRGVIHNAGLDSPARLARKTDAQVVRTVAVKVDGFLTLFSCLTDRGLPVEFLCAVGSLTGRLGGMVGQLDYAAANEALSRLALWADRRSTYPVMTLAWPTWSDVGLITNLSASLRYMTAMDPVEGVRHWQAELEAGTRGEVTYIGSIGEALDPAQAIGYQIPDGLPNRADVRSRIFHLGEVRAFRPGRLLDAVVTLGPECATRGELRIDGEPAVPAVTLVENAVEAARWLRPAPDGASLTYLRGIEFAPALLGCGTDPLVLRRRMEVDGSRVLVTFTRAGQAVPVLCLSLESNACPAAPPEPALGPASAVCLRWRPSVIPAVAPGSLFGRPAWAADRWVVPHAPNDPMPVAEFENALRLALGDTPAVARVNIAEVVFAPAYVPRDYRLTRHRDGCAAYSGEADVPVLRMRGVQKWGE
jgi:NAD(P)-dependent dehydrogenase (short-subunit alcohol dehydrogenase family)